MTIRVRFAPSPTGWLHLGGLRTALYNFLFCRKNKGQFVLRLEDTDRKRFVEGAEKKLVAVLHQLGLDWDEGPDTGGQYQPYRQSERLDIYRTYIDELIGNRKAYYCFCSQQRLATLRETAAREKRSTNYDRHCLQLSSSQVKSSLQSGHEHVVRLRIPDSKEIILEDLIHGRIRFNTSLLDDQILLKADGFPTYHLANVVDDHLMKITHVIRGDEWLSSTPKHLILYDALNWTAPKFAHLPLILNSDRSKLSKRQNDVTVEHYIEKGFLPPAILNYLALLGWSSKDDREFFNLEELIRTFDLGNVSKSGCIFDMKKLVHINSLHLREMSITERCNRIRQYIENNFNYNRPSSWVNEFILEINERLKSFDDISKFLLPFIQEFDLYEKKPEKKFLKKPFSLKILTFTSDLIRTMNVDENSRIEESLRAFSERNEISFGKVAGTIRVALTGCGVSIGLFKLIQLIGREKTLERLSMAIQHVNNFSGDSDDRT